MRKLHVRGAVAALVVTISLAAEPVVAQEKAKIAAGERVYATYCQICHGDDLISTGQFPDLRRLKADDRARFENAVLNGKNQMPPWRGVVSDEQIDLIWAYIRSVADR
jgi:mono/diheme cytochrome c family protein